MNLIELQNITFTYETDEPPVLNGLSLSLHQGSCLIVKGENGSGKTTLFRILNGLSFPQKGSFWFDGMEITEKYLKDNRHSKLFHKRIGYLFQNPDIMLFCGKVYDEIAFGPRQLGMTEKETAERVRDCMEQFGISELSEKAPYHLSGGQKKKVALAAVIALNPEVLILDEPYAGLDGGTIQQLTDFLKNYKAAGRTLIIATHSETLGEELGDEFLTLQGGRIL